MRNPFKFTASILPILLSLSLSNCGCGFDCNNGNNSDEPGSLSLGFSDALPEDLKQVVITVDSITLRRSGADDVVVERFTIDDLDLTDADTFQMDLLKYRGVNQLLVIEGLQLEKGSYSALSVEILDGDINNSYVQESDDSLKEISVTNPLVLPGIDASRSTQAFTVEFSLAQALQQNSGSDTYTLASTGIRVENTATAARLSGQVDASLFNATSPCDEKTDPEAGNRLYLYKGTGLDTDTLADVFTSDSESVVPSDALAPFAVASLLKNSFTGTWEYAFGYLPAGGYTMVFACDTEDDDAVEYNGLTVPLPENQVYEFKLSEADQVVCNVSIEPAC